MQSAMTRMKACRPTMARVVLALVMAFTRYWSWLSSTLSSAPVSGSTQ